MNIINGAWVRDIEQLRHGNTTGIVRPPVDRSRYFQGSYGVPTRSFCTLERTHAFLINNWVKGRGFKGGLYFVDRRRIEPERYKAYQASGGTTGPTNQPIPNPLRRRLERWPRRPTPGTESPQ